MNAPESVVLDYTLHDLYTADHQDHDIWLVYAYAPPPGIQLEPHLPAPTQFPVQSPLCPTIDKDELARTLFHLTAQRFGFCSGPMRILVPVPDSQDENGPSSPRSHTEISRVFGQLQQSQQPIPTYTPTRDLAKPPLNARTKLAITVPLDWIAHLPHVIDPRAHYNLLSKRGLAESGLPTPKTVVIDTILSLNRPCAPADLEQEVTRMTQAIREHPLPFIVKVPRVASIGQGTFIVLTESDRASAHAVFLEEVKSMLLALNPANESLRPCNVILQEMISGETVGLTFFVTQAGRAIYNCCTRQEVDDAYCWSGGLISYTEQSALERQYRTTMEKVAGFLHGSGYFGPAGVDVMTDDTGTQLVVDLNVRITGTYHLGPLRGHFTRRGFVEAAGLATHRLRCTQTEFEKHFSHELRSGSVLVTAWVHAREVSLVTITVAARNRTELQGLIQKVSGFAELCWKQDALGSRESASKL